MLSCEKKRDKYLCNQLSFYIKFNNTDSYDSKKQLFERRYWGKVIKLNIQLNSEEMRKINLIFMQNDFLDLPNEIETRDIMVQSPIHKNVLSYKNSCVNKSVEASYSSEALQKNKKIKKVLNITGDIYSLLITKKEIKQLPQSNMYLE